MIQSLRLLALAGILLALQTGCLVRKRVVPPSPTHPNSPPLTATKAELIETVHKTSDPIESFLIKVDMAPSTGSQYKGLITDYATVGAFILYQKPDKLRVIGKDPIGGITIFEMVTEGRDFRISLPTKSRFVVGDNEAPPASKNALENLRPGTFLKALLIDPPDPAADITILEDETNDRQAVYSVLIIRRDGDEYRLMRTLYFDRYTLRITGQRTYDRAGQIATDTTYSDWKAHGKFSFPSEIDVKSVRDSYEVRLSVLDVKMNLPSVTPDQFQLAQPAGAQLIQVK